MKLFLTSLVVFSSRYYVAGIIIGPVIFYFPKFFELRTRYVGFSLNIPVDCYLVLNQIKNSSSQGNYIIKVSYFVESSCFALKLCLLFVVFFFQSFFLSFWNCSHAIPLQRGLVFTKIITPKDCKLSHLIADFLFFFLSQTKKMY